MKKVSYKLIVLLFIGTFYANAQEKKYYKEIKVNPDVVIDINTIYSDVEISRWDEDKIIVEAFMIVEGEEFSKEKYKDFYKKWDFDVSGNTENLVVKSTTNTGINVFSFDVDNINYDDFIFPLADVSIGSLDVLDSIDFITAPLPVEMPEIKGFSKISGVALPLFPNLPSDFNFDLYQKDKSYLERWKKENEDFIKEKTQVKIVDDLIVFNFNGIDITMNEWEKKIKITHKTRELIQEHFYNRKVAKAINEQIVGREKFSEEEKEEIMEKIIKKKKQIEEMKMREKRIKKMKKNIKKELKNQSEERLQIKKVLKERFKLKVQRMIRIKAPRKAKFNMNMQYGELEFKY